ncbi:VWA domain-containing protein [Salegentibacter sp. HM20]
MFLEEKIYFWLLLAVPLVVLLYLVLRIWQARTRKKFADPDLLRQLSPNRSSFKQFLKLLFVSLALASLAIALVNPKMGSKMETVKREGVDIVFAIDVSKSMDAEDVAPNRLEKSKQLVRQIMGDLAGDRIGLIAYAGSAYPQLPITTDYSAARMFLQSLNTDMLSSQGTAIADAITLASDYFEEESQTNKVLVIISDGEDHEGNYEEVTREAAAKGIRIFTIGVGTEEGNPIPIKRNGVILNYKKDREGETVITRRDNEILTEIASLARGSYIDGNITAQVTKSIREELQNIERSEFEAQQFADFKSQFQWFLGLALLFLLLDVFILERKTAWLKRLDLFNEYRKKEK